MPTDLHCERLEAVKQTLLDSGARRILDLGCGSGELLIRLLTEERFQEIVGVDTSLAALEAARREIDKEHHSVDGRLKLIHGSYTECNERLRGYDAATLVETIEHIEPTRLSAVESAVFRFCRPQTVVITTPNRDYNALHGGPDHRLRHRDHCFEWGRERFEGWANGLASRNGYAVSFRGIGPYHPCFGAPTQMATFHGRGTSG